MSTIVETLPGNPLRLTVLPPLQAAPETLTHEEMRQYLRDALVRIEKLEQQMAIYVLGGG